MTGSAETELLLLVAGTVRLSVPLLLAALAGIFAERSGVADLGLEGKMLAGAFAAAAVAAVTGHAAAGLLAAMAAGLALSLVHFYATVAKPGDQVVSGMAINLIAAGLIPTMAYALFDLGGQTPALAGDARLTGIVLPLADASATGFVPRLYAIVVSGQTALVYLALLLVPISTAVIYRTGWGLRLRAVGENPEAVAAAGRNVVRLRLQALIVNGMLCGLAGAYLSLAANAGYARNMTAGKGYLAIAALILGRWKPWPTFGACLLFAAADAIQGRLQGAHLPFFGAIPAVWISALPYFATVLALAITGRGVAMPRALGVPYARGRG
ncbi:MAG TPA: ABC transporter permease [Alphaproteobacteria bacterium]|nr:ABC transporter permease [Alphaproteobacteria bacterium]